MNHPLHRSRRLVLAAIVAAAPARPVMGQIPPRLEPGDRVRVTAPILPDGILRGRLLFLSTDTVSFMADRVGRRILDLRSVDRFELNRGKHPVALAAAIGLGMVLGAQLGPIVFADSDRCEVEPVVDPDCVQVTSDPVIGAILGGVAGLYLSPLVVRDRWVEIPMNHLRLEVSPSVRGPGRAGIRISFPIP